MVLRAHHSIAATIISGVTLTTKLFTLAVFVYCGLNFLMYRRIRKSNEREKKRDEEAP